MSGRTPSKSIPVVISVPSQSKFHSPNPPSLMLMLNANLRFASPSLVVYVSLLFM